MISSFFKKLFQKACSGSIILTIFIPQQLFSSQTPYRIGPGDHLNISFSIQGTLEDISKLSPSVPIQIIGDNLYYTLNVFVASDGTISLPGFNNPLTISEMTLKEMEIHLSQNMVHSTKAGNVTVSLVKSNNLVYYVWGEVNHAGYFPIDKPTSIIEAISHAGGPTANAKLKKIIWLKPNGQSKIIDLSAAKIKNGFQTVIPQIEASDTIIIPRKKSTELSLWFFILTLIGTSATVAIAAR